MIHNDNTFKVTIFIITHDYIDGKETIDEMMKNYNSVIKDYKKCKSFKDKISNVSLRIECLNTMLCMKKIQEKKYRKDGLVILEELEKQVKEIKKIFGSEK